MGWLSELGKAFMGQPLGQPSKDEPKQSDEQPQSNSNVDTNGRKVIPEFTVKNLRSRRNGDNMDVRAWFTNTSDQQIRIDSTNILGQKRQHNQELRPNESRELQLYLGEVAKSEHDDNARIEYRLTANGDLFQNTYHVEFNRESDGSYVVEELHDDGPVRDI